MLVYIREQSHVLYHINASVIPKYLHVKYALRKLKENRLKRNAIENDYCKTFRRYYSISFVNLYTLMFFNLNRY